MVTFTQIPEHYAPLAEEAVYAFESSTAETIYMRITDAADDSLIGAKRFASVIRGRFDAAPLLRRAIRFTPAAAGTGIRRAADRQIAASVEAFTETSPATPAATAPTRIFLPCAGAAAPALLTSMPRVRLIAPNECEELTLLCDEACSVTVTAAGRESLTAQSYPVPTAGLYLFRLDMRDFAQAETLRIDAGKCGAVEYSVIPAPQGAVRLAWRSAAGSLEHYTFPVVRETSITAIRQEAYGPEGYAAAAAAQQRRQLLVSAYEQPAVLEALAQLQTTPQVWIAEGERYTPADVLPGNCVIRRHGELCCLETTIRPKFKTRLPWN